MFNYKGHRLTISDDLHRQYKHYTGFDLSEAECDLYLLNEYREKGEDAPDPKDLTDEELTGIIEDWMRLEIRFRTE